MDKLCLVSDMPKHFWPQLTRPLSSGMLKTDAKQPNGVTLVPWSMNAFCLGRHVCGYSGSAVELAYRTTSKIVQESRLRLVIHTIWSRRSWLVESSALSFFKIVSKIIIVRLRNPIAGSYLAQCCIAIQRRNAASVLGTVPRGPVFHYLFSFSLSY